jgi:16S rRNA (guanine(966)-N(2))-methyltransferase RsmD
MRIIAGSKRGMKIFSPEGHDSRPITDRVKESLFNVLCKYDLPGGAVVADLFCGVGSLGLEALSRGAQFVAFVERDRNITDVLKRNIEKAGFIEQSKVIIADAFNVAVFVDAAPAKFDLVFVDSPYADSADVGVDSPLGKLLTRLSQKLQQGSFVIVRSHEETNLLARYGVLETIERRRWGSMAVTILRRRADDQ